MITIDPPIEKLSIEERIQLIEQIEATLPHAFDPFSDEVMAMLKEREAATERGENPSHPLDEVFARIRKERASRAKES